MNHLLEILWDALNSLGWWPWEKKRSSAGESELDRQARFFGRVGFALLLVLTFGVCAWLFLSGQ